MTETDARTETDTGRNPHAGRPFTDDDAAIAAALEDLSVPALLCSLVHMTGDPSWIRTELRPQASTLNDYQGSMSRGDDGRGPPPRPPRHRRLPRRRLRAAARRRPSVIREMMAFLAAAPVRRRRRADVPRRPAPRRRRQRRHHLGRRDPRRRARRRARDRDRLRRGRAPGRHPPAPGGHPVHHHREERRPRRHVVGQPLPGRPRRHRQPLLLLLVRARRPLDRVLLPAARAARLLRPGDAQVPDRGALPVRDHRRVGGVRRRHRPLVGHRHQPRRQHRGDRRPCDRQRGRRAEPAEAARHPRHGRLRGPVVPLGALGPVGRLPGQEVRVDRRGRQRLPDRADHRRRRRAAHRVPAHRAVGVPQPQLPPRRARRRALGDAAPAVLRALVPLPHLLPGGRARHGAVSASTRTTTTAATPSARRTARRASCSPPDRAPSSAATPSSRPRSSPTTRRRPSACCRTTARGWRACGSPTWSWCARRSRRSCPKAWSPSDGTFYPADVICYATGFRHNDFLWPHAHHRPRRGVLREQWGEEPTAYYGITVPNFPNLFCLYGPGTNLAHGGEPDLPVRVPGELRDGRHPRELLTRGTGRSSPSPRCTTRTPSSTSTRSPRWCGRTSR